MEYLDPSVIQANKKESMKKIWPLEIYKKSIAVLAFLICTQSYGQTDSVIIGGLAGLRGMWQTGNLNQINLMPNGTIWLKHTKHYAEVLGTFHYIKVDGFEAKNDLWLYSLYQYSPSNRFFPSANAVTGYAVSYKLDHSIVVGIGGGVNLIKKSPTRYLQFQVYSSYLDFKFVGEDALKSFAFSSLLRANIPMTKWLTFGWELGSYHSIREAEFWGGGNLYQLIFNLTKNFSVNISHQTYYNHQAATNIEKTNTQMLFGFQYSFSNTNY